MNKKFRTLASWILVSLMLQFPFYYFLNQQVEKVMAPGEENKPIVVKKLEAEIPGTSLQDFQISYAKDYLAYKENGVLKVFNLKQNKVVFEKKAPAGNDKNLGVLHYQWLPDRDTLVYFYARKNPNPYTMVEVPVTPATPAKAPTQGTTPSASGTNAQNPAAKPDSTPTKPTNATGTNPQTSTKQLAPNTGNVKTQATTPKIQEVEKVEDPNQTPAKPSAPETPKASKPETRLEKRYNNPQITELFTLELPPSDEEGTMPDDRFNRSIDSFPAGGQIQQMVVSTFTNLMYLTIKNGANLQLMEIDIMKNVRTLNRSGEVITQMAASDKFGTLYVKSIVGKTEQIVALQGWEREIISKDAQDVILGDRSGTIYLGKVQEGRLVNIRSAVDTSDDKDLSFKTLWEGSIPFKDPKRVIIGAQNEVVVYDNNTAYVVKEGKEKEIQLEGEENFISSDGVELIQLSKVGMSTKVKLQPLED